MRSSGRRIGPHPRRVTSFAESQRDVGISRSASANEVVLFEVRFTSVFFAVRYREGIGMIVRVSAFLKRMYEPGAALLLSGRVIQLLNSLLLSFVIVRKFGLETMGTFAVGFIGVAFLTALAPMGLPSHLPHLRAAHSKLCYSALIIQLSTFPFFALLLYAYASLEAHNVSERVTIFVVTLGGLLIGSSNIGMMLSIMRRRFYPGLVGPLCESGGILVGAFVAKSSFGLAVFLLAARLASVVVIWCAFHFRWVSIRRVICIAQRGIGYAMPDVLALLSEQSAPLLLSGMVSRSELGQFRLCQQMLTAADTPGWTFVQSKYPDLVRGTSALRERIYAQTRDLGWAAVAICFLVSAFLAYYVYRIPTLLGMMSILSATLVWRYKNNYFEQRFRAMGQLGTTTILALMKLAASFVLFFFFIRAYGGWGAVVALGLLSVIAGITYEYAFRRLPPAAVAWYAP
jgi:O-antigen/teichoic acid export membrane protein